MCNEHIERIKNMEIHLEEAQNAVSELQCAIDNFIAAQKHIVALAAYYTDKEWLMDYDADCKGEIPADLKRGVLSQDAIHNLLSDNKKLLDLINFSK